METDTSFDTSISMSEDEDDGNETILVSPVYRRYARFPVLTMLQKAPFIHYVSTFLGFFEPNYPPT